MPLSTAGGFNSQWHCGARRFKAAFDVSWAAWSAGKRQRLVPSAASLHQVPLTVFCAGSYKNKRQSRVPNAVGGARAPPHHARQIVRELAGVAKPLVKRPSRRGAETVAIRLAEWNAADLVDADALAAGVDQSVAKEIGQTGIAIRHVWTVVQFTRHARVAVVAVAGAMRRIEWLANATVTTETHCVG